MNSLKNEKDNVNMKNEIVFKPELLKERKSIEDNVKMKNEIRFKPELLKG